MNRDICIKRNCRSGLLLGLLLIAPVTQPSLAQNTAVSNGVLVGQIDYRFVGHLGQTDDQERLLVWEATIVGDVTGRMKWWFANPPAIAEVAMQSGRVSFYTARWEIWADEELLLAGESAGKTVFPGGADGIWDGHGRVTEAEKRFKDLIGRRIYETGPVILGSDPPKTFTGTGAFVVL